MNKEKLIRRRMQDAQKHHRMGHYDRALELYESVLKIDPNHEQANLELFRCASDEWSEEKKAEESDRLVELFPQNAEAWMFRGISYTKYEKPEEAEESYRRSLELDPENYRAMHNLGSLLVNLEKREEGLSLLEKAVDIRPDYEIGHLTLAQVYFLFGRFDDAVSESELAPGAITGHPDLQIVYGESLYKTGNFIRAREIFSHVVETTLLSSQMYEMLCPILRESDEYQHQGNATGADPDFLAATYYRAFLSLENEGGKMPMSESDLQKLLDINPSHGYALSGIASLYKLNGQVPEAVAWIDKAIESDPENYAFIRQKAFILIDDEPQASLDLFNSLVNSDSADLKSGLGKAWALSAVGKDDESKALLKALSDQDPAFIFGLMSSPLGGTAGGCGPGRIRSMSE
jgi:tetratricopeptide (TPR) repeat protein